MEERDNLIGDGIHSRKIRALTQIAAMAGQRKIVRLVATAMLLGDDVLDVMGEGAVGLRELTMLAAVICPAPNQLAGGGIHR